MGEDYEGRVIATLVRSDKNVPDRPSILYLHGFNDYFFHEHVAEAFHEQGYNFYALDLRKYGRSLLAHQHPNYCRSITEYFEEIDRSIEIIRSETDTDEKLLILGHSTGGLIASVYQNTGEYRDQVDGLILNSPFLEFNITPWQRWLLLPMAGVISFFAPYAARRKPLSHVYGASVSNQKKGEWHFNTEWKPLNGFPAYLQWIYAVNRAQKKLHLASDISVPVLILHSDASSRPKRWNNIVLKTDMVLNVEHMKKFGRKLGSDVSFAEIPRAIHDVFLSKPEVRQTAFRKMFSWLSQKIEIHSSVS